MSATAGIAAALIVALVGPWWLIPLAAWDIAAALLLGWTWGVLWRLDGVRTASHAKREGPNRANSDLLLLGGSVVSLGAVGLVLVRSSHESGLAKGLLVGCGVISIVLAWAVVHTVYTLRYAKLYYDEPRESIEFHEDRPAYVDFAYLALTIGMTFQVSDTDLTTTSMRRMALKHALLSYMFGTLIIATTINLIAQLGT